MAGNYTFLGEERLASIREVQRNPSKALQGITRVVRGSHTLGFFFAHPQFDDLLEDIEALASPSFKARVRAARRALKAGKTVPLSQIATRYGVSD